MSKFEKIDGREVGHAKRFAELKQNLQMNVQELYFQRFLKQEEVLVLLKEIAMAKDRNELRKVERKFHSGDAVAVSRADKDAEAFSEMQHFKIFLDKSIDKLAVSNWRDRFVLLLGKVNGSYEYNYHETLIKAWLAEFLEEVYRCHLVEKVDIRLLGEQLGSLLNEKNFNLPSFLKTQNGVSLGKRKPSFVESVDATMERFYKIEDLKNLLRDLADGIIIGGSMSYGPFFNIRKALDETGSADVDLIVILPEDKLDVSWWKKFQESDLFDDTARRVFFDRMNVFGALLQGGEVDIFSQKFHVRNTDFDISIHFFPPRVFDSMVGKQFQNDLLSDQDTIVVLNDFKAKEFPHAVCAQQNFLGEQYAFDVPAQRSVDGGVITELPSYIIQNHHFYPGIYQNLISPCFSVCYDRGGTMDRVTKFKSIMGKRAEQEKGACPEAQLLKSHIRHKIFSPELFKKYQ